MMRVGVICFWLVFAGCSTARYSPPEKAILDVANVEKAIEIETTLDARGTTPVPSGGSWFQVLEGTTRIIITAPHATQPFRENRYQFADGGGTAALAVLLHELSGATVLFTTFASCSDPNYYDDNAFKDALSELIERTQPTLLLDLHGSHGYRPYEVDLGTMDGASLLGNERPVADLVSALAREGIGNVSGNYFAASKKNATITKFASARRVPAIQLEINATWLDPRGGTLMAHRFAQLAQALVRYVAEQGRARPRERIQRSDDRLMRLSARVASATAARR